MQMGCGLGAGVPLNDFLVVVETAVILWRSWDG